MDRAALTFTHEAISAAVCVDDDAVLARFLCLLVHRGTIPPTVAPEAPGDSENRAEATEVVVVDEDVSNGARLHTSARQKKYSTGGA